jgi:hypothetical protein
MPYQADDLPAARRLDRFSRLSLERHELEGTVARMGYAVRAFGDTRQRCIRADIHGYDKRSVYCKLIYEGLRNFIRLRAHDYRIERRFAWIPVSTVSVDHGYAIQTKRRKVGTRVLAQRLAVFNSRDQTWVTHDIGQQGQHVAGTGSYLQDPIRGRNIGQAEHVCNSVRLADGLAVADFDWAILPRRATTVDRNKHIAGYVSERVKDYTARNTLIMKHLDEAGCLRSSLGRRGAVPVGRQVRSYPHSNHSFIFIGSKILQFKVYAPNHAASISILDVSLRGGVRRGCAVSLYQ